MFEKTLIFKDFDSIREFVKIANGKPYDIELSYAGKAVNAKKTEEVFTLDLTKPLVCVAHCDNPGEFLMQIRKFVYRK
ncbi:MAG: HPr family phosphocarrier protein [Clostridia bacterium]|nr:HPr family phosphocarrier protein [Clostridia bacterium]